MNTQENNTRVDLDANNVGWPAVMDAINALKQTANEKAGESSPAVYDPLVDILAIYRRGVDAFNSDPATSGNEERKMEETFGPAFRVLKAWTAPAQTRAGAMAALREANLDLQAQADDDFAARLIGAALAFFETEHGETVQ